MSQMPSSKPEPIEGVAEAVERVMAGLPEAAGVERRRAKRFLFPVVQYMAQYDRTGLPSRDRFQPIRCQDLSSSGVSFFWPRVPDFEYVVIGLDTDDALIHLSAGHIGSPGAGSTGPTARRVSVHGTNQYVLRALSSQRVACDALYSAPIPFGCRREAYWQSRMPPK